MAMAFIREVQVILPPIFSTANHAYIIGRNPLKNVNEYSVYSVPHIICIICRYYNLMAIIFYPGVLA